MEMMDSTNLPFVQSMSKVDNRFNGWSTPLFKVALCPPDCQTLFLPWPIGFGSRSGSDRFSSRIRFFMWMTSKIKKKRKKMKFVFKTYSRFIIHYIRTRIILNTN